MNIFRFIADMLHLISIFVLLYKIYRTKSVQGLSLQTQVLYVVVFCCRYLDLFVHYYSLYNTVMKLIYIITSIQFCYLIKVKFFSTYDKDVDTFRKLWLILLSAVLSLLLTKSYYPRKLFWTFSIWLEAVAIFPQLIVLNRIGKCEAVTGLYMFLLGSYRALYIVNWIYRYFGEGFFQMNAVLAGIVQTLLYCEFLYLYVKKVIIGRQYDLPFNDK